MAQRRPRRSAARGGRDWGRPAAPAASAEEHGGAGPARAPWGTRVRGAVAQAFDLPRELVLDLPRLTFLGPLHVAVENHRGLVEFDTGRVTIATASGRLVVVGRDLTLGVVRQGEITIAGVVAAVRFEPPPAAER